MESNSDLQKKEIIVFTDGDSDNINTWSNVPYFLTKTLENKGYIVHRVNIEPKDHDLLLCRIFSRLNRYIGHVIGKEIYGGYNYTGLYRTKIRKLMRKKQQEFANSGCCIAMDFNTIIPKYKGMKIVLLHDWSLDYFLDNHLHRSPVLFEKNIIWKQHLAIKQADLTVTLFPHYQKYIMNKIADANIVYLGHVINSKTCIYNEEQLTKRFYSNEILFVGRRNYIEGAVNLINTVNRYNNQYDTNITVNIIGMNREDFDSNMKTEAVSFWGYIDKNSEKGGGYYDILGRCKFIVNTTEKWAGASSIIEAMYHYIPIIISDFNDFTDMFGKKINFGYYCEHNTVDSLLPLIDNMFVCGLDEYLSMCHNARKSVESFTWDSYIFRLMEKIEK